MKNLLLVAILVFPVLMLGVWFYHGSKIAGGMTESRAEKSVKDRLVEFGPAARARMRPMFESAHVEYPPTRLVFIGLKAEKVLQIYAGSSNQPPRYVGSYPILAASGVAGPKLMEGDKQLPEGVYAVESLNPNSKYHVALRLNYPNEFDKEKARVEGRENLGGDIMIHGGAASVGCLAMGDQAAEDLFVLAADTGRTNISVILCPADLRKTDAATSGLPAWTAALYQTIKARLNELQTPK